MLLLHKTTKNTYINLVRLGKDKYIRMYILLENDVKIYIGTIFTYCTFPARNM